MKRKFIIRDPLQPVVQAIRANKILFAIVLAGALFRLWSIDWSLPDLYEEATPLVKSWKMWNWGGEGFAFNPHFFNYPALTFYLHFLLQALQFLLGFALGIYRSISTYGAEMTSIVIPARLLGVAFDTGTIWVLAKLVREEAGEEASYVAAALVALNPLHIEQSHYIIVDIPLAFFITLSLLYIFRVFRSGERKWYLLAGVSIGLATATKYTGLILIPALVAVHMMRSTTLAKSLRSLRVVHLWLAMFIAAGVFFLTNPFILLSYDEFVRDFSFEQFHIAYGHLGLNPGQSTIGYYCLDILPTIFGWPLLVLVVATLAFGLIRKDKQIVLLLILPAMYFVMISSWEMRAPRYSLPMVTSLLAVASVGFGRIREWLMVASARIAPLGTLPGDQKRLAAALVLGLLLLFQPLISVYGIERTFSTQDTRTAAREWIQRRVRPGAAIATGPFGIVIPDSVYRTIAIPFLAEESERVAGFYDTRWYEDCDLLIASDFDEARYRAEPKRYGEFFPYYDTLRSSWHHLLEIKPVAYQPGPTIWYFAPPDTSPSLFDSTLFARLESVPESAKTSEFLRELTVILIQKGKLQKAKQVLVNIISVEPENLEARYTLARVLLTLGDNEHALTQVQYIAYRDASHPEVFTFAGDVLVNLGRGEQAEQSYWKAVALDKNYAAAYEDLIEYYTRSKQDGKLLATLKRYRALVPPGSAMDKDINGKINDLEKKISPAKR
jgi:4-amino-4-deoxy-L-arabinose transferase-like glycosyltransferase/tetratricopeptide (TPR) repeat protein